MLTKNEILIIGFGSDILTDDDISARLVKDIRESGLVSNADYCSFLTSSMDLIEHFSDYQIIILIDAVKTNKYPVGELIKFDIEHLDYTLHLSNFHDHSFPEIINAGCKCGYRITNEIHFFGVEIEEAHVFSSELSEHLQKLYPDVKMNLIEAIHRLIERVNHRNSCTSHKIPEHENI
jgi:hydrogenase maturation protease